jgi:hypothetical protein
MTKGRAKPVLTNQHEDSDADPPADDHSQHPPKTPKGGEFYSRFRFKKITMDAAYEILGLVSHILFKGLTNLGLVSPPPQRVIDTGD